MSNVPVPAPGVHRNLPSSNNSATLVTCTNSEYESEQMNPHPNWNSLALEVVQIICQKLDAVSLYYVAKLCIRWKEAVKLVSKEVFEKGFLKYWPSKFRDKYVHMDYEIFSALLDSLYCPERFLKESLKRDQGHIDAHASLRLYNGLCRSIQFDYYGNFNAVTTQCVVCERLDQEILSLPGVGYDAFPSRKNELIWTAMIDGPSGSPYANGVFYLRLKFTMRYTAEPPKVTFLTKIFHPAVNSNGEIKLNILGTRWRPWMNISIILSSIRRILADPIPIPDLEDTPIRKLYLEDKPEFVRLAKEYTEKYAQLHLLSMTNFQKMQWDYYQYWI